MNWKYDSLAKLRDVITPKIAEQGKISNSWAYLMNQIDISVGLRFLTYLNSVCLSFEDEPT